MFVWAVAPDDVESLISGDVGPAPSRPLAPPTSIARTAAAAFSEKFVEVYQSPLLPSSTPHTLPHHFLTYNMVGVVRSHNDDDTHMIEVGILSYWKLRKVGVVCHRWNSTIRQFTIPSAFLITMATTWPRWVSRVWRWHANETKETPGNCY